MEHKTLLQQYALIECCYLQWNTAQHKTFEFRSLLWRNEDTFLLNGMRHTMLLFLHNATPKFILRFSPFCGRKTHRRNTKARRKTDFVMNFDKQFSLVLWYVYSVFIQRFGDNFRLHHFMDKKSALTFSHSPNILTIMLNTAQQIQKIAEEVSQFACNTNLKYGQHNIQYIPMHNPNSNLNDDENFLLLLVCVLGKSNEEGEKSVRTEKSWKMNRKKLWFGMWT